MSLRKAFKILGLSVSALLALLCVAGGAAYGVSHYRLNKKYTLNVAQVKIPDSPDAIARGRHIAVTRGCLDCHAQDLGGGTVINDAMVGIFHAPNLTHGKGGLPPEYSDSDYVMAIRHGISRDGRPLALMPSQEYSSLSDEDLGMVIAFLKTVPSVDRERIPVKPGPLARVLIATNQMKISAEHIDHAAMRPAAVHPGINPEYGKYLAASCIGCHGESLSGGKIAGAPPDWPAASDLTPLKGSPRWTETEFIDLIRTRQRPDGTSLNPAMPSAFAQMTDEELKALWSYLASLAPETSTASAGTSAGIAAVGSH